ncbi:MAG: histidinol-phosphatase [Armatimonadetes bacterium]|nr:histidinol-phosphatase [Armatimonadota bacterium]
MSDDVLEDTTAARWWKGNLHTHTFWSDGDDYPEMVVDWYRSRDYNFLALSDHNILSDKELWMDMSGGRGAGRPLVRYLDRFGDDWVETRVRNNKTQVRLKTLSEFRGLFEEPGEFLLIQSEEITDSAEGKPVHVNATNIQELIRPQRGKTVFEAMQNNVNAVLEQRERTGVPMFPHINHPNFGWAVTAEDLMKLEGEKFFEVYNGHPSVRNFGDANHAGGELMWDIILTVRLAELGKEVMYGMATDDAHNYFSYQIGRANPGRAWVVVRAVELTAASIVAAMERGDFYGSTGVVLRNIVYDGKSLSIEIEPEEGVTYQTMFIGTRRGYDRSSEPILNADGAPLAVTRKYSDEIGEVFSVVDGLSASYTLHGDEIYVRAKVVSSKTKVNPFTAGETEVAWVQPVVPGTE